MQMNQELKNMKIHTKTQKTLMTHIQTARTRAQISVKFWQKHAIITDVIKVFQSAGHNDETAEKSL